MGIAFIGDRQGRAGGIRLLHLNGRRRGSRAGDNLQNGVVRADPAPSSAIGSDLGSSQGEVRFAIGLAGWRGGDAYTCILFVLGGYGNNNAVIIIICCTDNRDGDGSTGVVCLFCGAVGQGSTADAMTADQPRGAAHSAGSSVACTVGQLGQGQGLVGGGLAAAHGVGSGIGAGVVDFIDNQSANSQVVCGIVVRPLLHADLDNVFARVRRFFHQLVVLIVFDRDITHAGDADLLGDCCGLGVSVVGQASGRGKGEVACLRVSPLDGILHAGGRIAHGDAGGIGARVGGDRVVFQFLWTIRAHLDVANGDITHRRTLPIAACGHHGGLAAAVVGQLVGGLDGHAAAVRAGASRVCAARGDGRAACRVRPAMLMPGHGERLAVALVAVVAPHMNAVLVAAVFRQIADGERLAFRPGMLRIIHFAEIRTTEPLFV